MGFGFEADFFVAGFGRTDTVLSGTRFWTCKEFLATAPLARGVATLALGLDLPSLTESCGCLLARCSICSAESADSPSIRIVEFPTVCMSVFLLQVYKSLV